MASPAMHPWWQLNQKQDKTEADRALIAAILILSTQHDPQNEARSFSHLTFEECFDKLVTFADSTIAGKKTVAPQKKYRFKSEIVLATQWFRNGDHPDDEFNIETLSEGKVVRYFRSPDMPGERVCPLCGNTMHEHGWIDGARNQGVSHVVCPGDWVVTASAGVYAPYKPDTFARIFEEVL